MKRNILFIVMMFFVQICVAQISHPNNWQVIELGSKSVNFTTTRTEDTRDFIDQCNNGARDVIYKLTTTVRMQLEIKTCNSGLDGVIVYLHDSSGRVLEESRFNDGVCSNRSHGYIRSDYDLPTGTYYVACEGYYNGAAGNITTTITGKVATSGNQDGNTLATAIDLGYYSFDFTYIDTKNTTGYTNANSFAGNDVYYKFTLSSPMDITISHAGSGVSDTYMSLLQSNNAGGAWEYTYNDNSWDTGASSDCNQAFLRVYSLPVGTYYVISEGMVVNGNITTTIKGVLSANVEKTGDLMTTAIDIGVKSADFLFRDTQDIYYYNRDYYQCDHLVEEADGPAEDIFYKFTTTKTMDVSISHKELADYSYIHLLDSQGSCIAHHTVYSKGPENPMLVVENLPAGMYYVVTQGYFGSGIVSTVIEGIIGSGVIADKRQNYALTTIPTQSVFSVADLHSSDKLQTIQYYDGLGRLTQQIRIKAGGSGNTAEDWPTIAKDEKLIVSIGGMRNDLVSLQEYDAYGRKSTSWLPAAVSGNNGAYVNVDVVKAQSIKTNGNDKKPYLWFEYEPSPLGKVIKEYGAGADWQDNGKFVSTDYKVNISGNATFNCYLYKAGGDNLNPALSKVGNYATGQLLVKELKDEDNNTTYQFEDRLGRTLLTRKLLGSLNHDTYYVYNDCGYLCYVLPPRLNDEGILQAKLDELAYQYKYDNYGRCIAKKIPGCSWVYFVYDNNNQLIFTQDGEQRAKNPAQWSYHIYDELGRIILTGIHKTSETHQNLIDRCKDIVVREKWLASSPWGYTWTSFPSGYINTDSPLLANYYDNYNRVTSGSGSVIVENIKYAAEENYGAQYVNSALGDATPKGLLTGTRVRSLNAKEQVASELLTAMYYDNRGRLIQSKSTNQVGGYEKEYLAYDFVGNPVRKKHIHSATGKATQTELYSYTYDHAGRVIKTTHKLNGGATVVLAENTYDELGRLIVNQKHTQANLKTNYAYNVRSWTKTITSPLFNQALYYNESYGGSNKCYNGNISAMSWKLSTESVTRGYAFSYDNLLRLTNASYLQNGVANDSYKTLYTYDKHGNATSMQRYGKTTSSTYGLVDNLTLSYNGNQLLSVSDAVGAIGLSESSDFKNYSQVSTEYTYNVNGAMSKDLNKGLSLIQYNFLNLPRVLDIKSSVAEARLEYEYLADGRKLKFIQKWNPNFSPTPVIGSAVNESLLTQTKTTEYVANKVYVNGSLQRILIPGGYIEGGIYYFYITDHLGNNRLVLNSSGTLIQKNHYYPFGMTYSETPLAEQLKQPYKYNGKELDLDFGLNLYDYGARFYDPALGRFATVDPLAEKKPWLSPYIYCSNNPINRIDPDGRDDYRLDRDGNLHFVKQTDAENHTLYATTSKGKLDSKNSLQVDKYVLNSKESVSGVQGMRSDGSIETSTLDIYTSFGNEKSTALFEFVSNNTDVEWSHTKTTQNEVNIDYISTSHQGNSDVSQGFVVNRIFKQNDRMSMQNAIERQPGINIREANHSHPNDSKIVSQGDVNLAKTLQSRFPNATMHNYAIPSRVYTEFNMYSMPGLLPLIEIVAPAIKKK